MKLLFPILGLAAAGALLAAGNKTASAASAQSSKPKAQQRAEWLSAIAHAKTQSYEQYVKVLNAAYKTGLFSQPEISKLQKQHRDFPKAGSGGAANTANQPSAPAATPSGPSIEQRVADALATQNPAVMRALANQIRATHPQAAADLESAALATEKLSGQATPATAVSTPRPTAPSVTQTSSKPKPRPRPAPTPVSASASTPVEAGRGPAPTGNKQLALDTAKMLTLSKKGREDQSLVERFQRSENAKRVLANRENGLNPDGRYGVDTAFALGEYGLVPPKPLYWGRGGVYQTMLDDKARWRNWCLTNASNDAARKAEWTGASKV
jgi:hypothetical protein